MGIFRVVFNGDPMTDVDYDLGNELLVDIPSGYVNRGSEIDPSDFEIEFAKTICTISSYFYGVTALNGNIIDVKYLPIQLL